ncbi:hypothetical protein P8452_58052 [Trifolium repens]|nr:hypothetical protein P8452_58052 [Trifolium repens]
MVEVKLLEEWGFNIGEDACLVEEGDPEVENAETRKEYDVEGDVDVLKALHRSRSSTVQPRFLIGVQHAPLRLFIGLFSELFDFELVRVIEDQEISKREIIEGILLLALSRFQTK